MSNTHYTVAREHVRWNIVDGQAVLIHTKSLYYYSLNRTGTVIWSALLERPMTEPEIIDTVAKHFGQPASDVTADVHAFLVHMVAEDLVQSDNTA